MASLHVLSRDMTSDLAWLLEICMSILKTLKDTITSMQLEGTDKRKPGGMNPVHDEMELDLVTSDKCNDHLPM